MTFVGYLRFLRGKGPYQGIAFAERAAAMPWTPGTYQYFTEQP